MTRIVRTAYRYKRPPRRKKPVTLEVPEVVKAADPAKARKRGKFPSLGNLEATTAANDDPKSTLPPAAERKSSIVTIRRSSRFGTAEGLTPKERNRRTDLADVMMQEFKRQIAERR
jgi:hypothetical protein